MRTSKQLSVTLVNKPGRLSTILSALSKEKVTCLALSVMNGAQRGILRFVPDNVEAATEALEKLNVRFESADVLLVPISSQPGAFPHICERLAAEHLNIDYAYCSLSGVNGTRTGVLAIIKVNDLAKAQQVLSETGPGNPVRRKLPRRRPVHAR